MSADTLTVEDLASIGDHTERHTMTLALVRTNESPQQLRGLFGHVSDACGLPLVRTIFSPTLRNS